MARVHSADGARFDGDMLAASDGLRSVVQAQAVGCEAAARTLELVGKDQVDFVVGSLSAATQLSINPVCRERKILFNAISQSDAINVARDWSLYTLHEALNPHITAGAVARYAFPRFGKKVVYLTADYAYGHEMARGFQRAGARSIGHGTTPAAAVQA